MNINRHIQLGVGILVIVSLCCFSLILLFGTNDFHPFKEGTHSYYASFDEIAGLYVKAPVRISGVKIGNVNSIDLDKKTYRAKISITVDMNILIPIDSVVKIYTEGVLGSKYISIIPGYETQYLHNNDTLVNTESIVILENLISQAINAFAGNK